MECKTADVYFHWNQVDILKQHNSNLELLHSGFKMGTWDKIACWKQFKHTKLQFREDAEQLFHHTKWTLTVSSSSSSSFFGWGGKCLRTIFRIFSLKDKHLKIRCFIIIQDQTKVRIVSLKSKLLAMKGNKMSIRSTWPRFTQYQQSYFPLNCRQTSSRDFLRCLMKVMDL